MHRLSPVCVLLAITMLSGCAPKEPPVPVKTVREIDAQIQEVQANTHMPASAKGMALSSLQKERAIAAKREGGK